MPLPDDYRERTRNIAESNFAALLAQHEVTPESIRASEDNLDRLHAKYISAATVNRHDGETARFKVFLDLKLGKGAAEKYLVPNGLPLTLPTLKAYTRIRAMTIKRPRFPNGITSVKATKGRNHLLFAIIKEATEAALPQRMKDQVEGYIETELRLELGLNTGTLAKPVSSFGDFAELLKMCWSSAPQFRTARERAQTHLFLLLTVFDMSRPGESTSNALLLADTDLIDGIIYEDLIGTLFVPKGSDALQVKFLVRWRNLKGKKLWDDQDKQGFHMQESAELAGFDATIFILALGLEDGVFEHFSSYDQLEQVPVEYVRAQGGSIPLKIKEDKKQIRLLQDMQWDPVTKSWNAVPDKALRYDAVYGKWKQLIRLCGYDDSATITSLRRMYQNLCEAGGVKKADRAQASGHNVGSRAYYQSYKSHVIATDTRRTFMGLPAKAVDNRVASMGLTRYGASAVELPAQKVKEAPVPDSILKDRKKLEELGQAVKLVHPTIKAGLEAEMPEALQHEKLRIKIKGAFTRFKKTLQNDHAKEQADQAAKMAFQLRPPLVVSSGSTSGVPPTAQENDRAPQPQHNPDSPTDQDRNELPAEELQQNNPSSAYPNTSATLPSRKGKEKAIQLSCNTDFPIDPELLALDEEEPDQSFAEELGQDNSFSSDQFFEELAENAKDEGTRRHQPALQRHIESLSSFCATVSIPLIECHDSDRLQKVFFPPIDCNPANIMTRAETITAILHSNFFTAQCPDYRFPGEQPTNDGRCPVTDCTFVLKSNLAKYNAGHIHGCVEAQMGRDLWEHYTSTFDLTLCPWQGCNRPRLQDPLEAARHFYDTHCVRSKATVCAVELENGICGMDFTTDVTTRLRHLEMQHGLIALSSKLKGIAAAHLHAEEHLERDIPVMLADPLCCQTEYSSSKAGKAADPFAYHKQCPFELFSDALSPIERWFCGVKKTSTTVFAAHINSQHILQLDPDQLHPCPWGLTCSAAAFNVADLAAHFETVHAIRLTPKATANKPWQSLNGDLSKLVLTGYEAKKRDPKFDEAESDSSEVEVVPAKKPKMHQHNDRFATMGKEEVRDELSRLHLPASGSVKAGQEVLRSYHLLPLDSPAQLQLLNKEGLKKRIKALGLYSKKSDTRVDCLRLLNTHLSRSSASAGPSTAPPETPTFAVLPMMHEDGDGYDASQLGSLAGHSAQKPNDDGYNGEDMGYEASEHGYGYYEH